MFSINRIEWGNGPIFLVGQKGAEKVKTKITCGIFILIFFEPPVCSVSELEYYLFSNSRSLSNVSRKFPGNSEYNRFMIVFNAVIEDKMENSSNLVVQLVNLGYKSTRKGYATMVTAGLIVALIMVIIFLRVRYIWDI